MFEYLFSEEAVSIWAALHFVVLVAAGVFTMRQVYLNRRANMLETIQHMNEKWDSDLLLKLRRDACITYLTIRGGESRSSSLEIDLKQGIVLGFFEELGLYSKKRVFEDEVVWDMFSYYIQHYWAMLEPHIMEFRRSKDDPSWFEKFEYLDERMKKYSLKNACHTTDLLAVTLRISSMERLSTRTWTTRL